MKNLIFLTVILFLSSPLKASVLDPLLCRGMALFTAKGLGQKKYPENSLKTKILEENLDHETNLKGKRSGLAVYRVLVESHESPDGDETIFALDEHSKLDASSFVEEAVFSITVRIDHYAQKTVCHLFHARPWELSKQDALLRDLKTASKLQ